MSLNFDIPVKYMKYSLPDFGEGIGSALLPFFSGEKLTVFLHGGVGSRKTSLAAAILREWRKTGKPSCQGSQWGEFVAAYKFSEAAKDFDGGKVRVKFWKVAKVLVMDDIGSDRNTDFMREQLLFILQYRYDYEKPTIVTSNLGLAGFAKHVDPRASSRLQEGIILNMGNADSRK